MFHRIHRRRAEKEIAEIMRWHAEAEERLADQVPHCDTAQHVADGLQLASEPADSVDDFLPPDLRLPSHDQVEGRMMPWQQPLVLDGEVVACADCGTYRNWLILSTRDEVWLRCRTGHQQLEPRLDTA